MVCYAVVCYVVFSFAVVCYAVVCSAEVCYAVVCYAVVCYAVVFCAVVVKLTQLQQLRFLVKHKTAIEYLTSFKPKVNLKVLFITVWCQKLLVGMKIIIQIPSFSRS